jgi:hypothetical protein
MTTSQNTAIDGNAVFRRLSFVGEVLSRVKNLSGWKKSFSVPDSANSRGQAYVAGIAAGDLKQDIDAVYDSLRQAFGFKRRELSVAGPADGTGTIVTPDFSYSISVSLNAADPTQIVWTRSVDGISEPRMVASETFARVFDGMFRTLQFALPGPIDVEDCIDAIEDAELGNVTVDYDREATYCELRFTEAAGAIRITANTLAIVEKGPAKIGALLSSLKAMQELVRKHGLPMDWMAAE